jgi:hypothetical protein
VVDVRVEVGGSAKLTAVVIVCGMLEIAVVDVLIVVVAKSTFTEVKTQSERLPKADEKLALNPGPTTLASEANHNIIVVPDELYVDVVGLPLSL